MGVGGRRGDAGKRSTRDGSRHRKGFGSELHLEIMTGLRRPAMRFTKDAVYSRVAAR
jgi:hypothetical protein